MPFSPELSRRQALAALGAAALNRPVRRVIDAAHPLVIVEGGLTMWGLLPESFRRHSAVMIHAGMEEHPLFTELEQFQKANAPVFIAVQGDEADTVRTPLPLIARALDRFPALLGCRVCELSCGPGMTANERRNLIHLIRLCGSKHALLNWQDMGYPYQPGHVFLDAGRDPELFRALAENGPSVILTEKNNGWGKYHQTRSLVMGMWLSGVVSNWGLNAEDWWWYEQGYGDRFVPSRGRRGWARQLAAGSNWEYGSAVSMPDILYGQNVLCAAAGGATVFSFESMHAYMHPDTQGRPRLTPAWTNVIYPLLETLFDKRLIPTQEQVRQRVRVAYTDTKDSPELEGTGEALYRPLYGATQPDDAILAGKLSNSLFPRTGRYYYLPVIPRRAHGKPFTQLIHPTAAESTGGATAFDINNTWYIINPHENQNTPEDFAIPLPSGQLSGRLEPHSLLLVAATAQRVTLQANNYIVKTHIWDEPRPAVFDGARYLTNYVTNPDDKDRRETRLTLKTTRRPQLTWHSDRGTVQERWSPESATLRLTLRHNGPVHLEVDL